MNYFTNQNKIQLCGTAHKECKEGRRMPGEFVKIVNGVTYCLGFSFKCIIRGIRPMAVDFSTQTPVEYYNPDSKEYQAVMKSEVGKGCHGAEVAMEIGGVICVYYFSNMTTRSLIPQAHMLIDEAVFIDSTFYERGKLIWHVPTIWVPAGRVESLIPIPDYDDVGDYI